MDIGIIIVGICPVPNIWGAIDTGTIIGDTGELAVYIGDCVPTPSGVLKSDVGFSTMLAVIDFTNCSSASCLVMRSFSA